MGVDSNVAHEEGGRERARVELLASVVDQIRMKRTRWIRLTERMKSALALADGPGCVPFFYIKRISLYAPRGTYYYVRLCRDQAIGILYEDDKRFIVDGCREQTGFELPYTYVPPESE
jgi:hypothetical protein